MIQLTRLNNEAVLVNSELIVLVEANPDTVITLTTGDRVRVQESMSTVTSLVVDFKRMLLDGAISRGDKINHG
jgi:flagellar protein FlbD